MQKLYPIDYDTLELCQEKHLSILGVKYYRPSTHLNAIKASVNRLVKANKARIERGLIIPTDKGAWSERWN